MKDEESKDKRSLLLFLETCFEGIPAENLKAMWDGERKHEVRLMKQVYTSRDRQLRILRAFWKKHYKIDVGVVVIRNKDDREMKIVSFTVDNRSPHRPGLRVQPRNKNGEWSLRELTCYDWRTKDEEKPEPYKMLQPISAEML